LKRLEGLLDFKKMWNWWLGYEQYGTTRTTSKEANDTGGRPEEPMCMRFFTGESEFPNQVLLQYKYKETDPHFIPYDHEGIPVFSEHALEQPDLLAAPSIQAPLPWPDQAAISNYLLNVEDMTERQRAEWGTYFENIPTSVADIPETKRFKWLLPELAKSFAEKRKSFVPEGQRVGESTRPERPDPRITWSQYTQADYNRDRRQRAANYANEQHALNERHRSEELTRRLAGEAPDDEDTIQDKELSSTAAASTPEPDKQPRAGSDDDSAECEPASKKRQRRIAPASKEAKKARNENDIPLGEGGIASVGDVVMFSPDDSSREQDRKNGYELGLCMGKITECDLKARRVKLWWLFGKDWTTKAKWVCWRDKATKKPYWDWVEADSLLFNTWGTVAKISLINKGHETYVIEKASVTTILDVLKTDSDD
jgi:hypothetical protein